MRRSADTIFVQIPSYRDTQLSATVEDLLAKAYNPDRLHICICFQYGLGENIPEFIASKNYIRILSVPCEQSLGVNWARSVLQKEWRGERYSLLIDSHMRFVKNWDEKLIRMMRQLKKKTAKPIISCLPPPFYDPATFPSDRMDYPLKIYPKEYTLNLLTRFEGHALPLFKWLKEPVPAEFIALGFFFSEGSFNTEIPFDPNIYFFGDDITTGLRAYCHGYDFFHPHRIIAWHLYDRRTRRPHWDDHENWFEHDSRSYERIHQVLKGTSFGEFQIGNTRDIRSYEAFTGYKLILQ